MGQQPVVLVVPDEDDRMWHGCPTARRTGEGSWKGRAVSVRQPELSELRAIPKVQRCFRTLTDTKGKGRRMGDLFRDALPGSR